MIEFAYAILSVAFVSLISFIGIFTFFLKERLVKKAVRLLVSFAAGVLLGAAFFDILPEALDGGGTDILVYVFAGLMVFFVMERYVHWHHCHKEDCEKVYHPMAYLNLIGDAFHNFVDGTLIAASFLVNIELGVVTTFAVIAHEIPQEIGDYVILINAKVGRNKALMFNFLTSLTAVFGVIVTFFFAEYIEKLVPVILAIAGGGFIYIATADLIPEIHKETERGNIITQSIALLFGILVIGVMARVFPA